MWAIETAVRELLAAAQAKRKAKLDAGRVDTVFKMGDCVLLRTKGCLTPQTLVSCASSGTALSRCRPARAPTGNAYTLALPRKIRCSPTVDVDRLKPYFARADEPPPPGPVSDAGQEDEHDSCTRWSCCSTAACSAA